MFLFKQPKKVAITWMLGVSCSLLAFQNCGGKAHFATKPDDGTNKQDSIDDGPANANLSCSFNGDEVSPGQSVIAYQNSTVPQGSSCVAQQRVCNDGNLSGSYNYADCQVDGPAACLLNGRSIASGDSIEAYLNSSSAAGGACVGEPRVCDNGVLSGTYNFTTCTDTPAKDCTFNGRTVAHKDSIKAYLSSTVPFGSTCQEEMRTCNNGNLTGSYNSPSCTVGAPVSCTFNGQAVAHGQTVIAYQNSAVASGASCIQESRTCNNGVLSGSYNFASCKVNAPMACLFNGQTIASGQNVKAFAASTVPFGQACVSSVRTCVNGQLSGSGDFASCTPGLPQSCVVNGKTYAHKESVTMFASSSVPFGQSCSSEVRTCNNGVMSGSAAFATCAPEAPQSCLFNGVNVAHGQMVKAFLTSAVPFNGSCTSEVRTCNNGLLSGSYAFNSCSVTPAKSCSVNGVVYQHGQSETFFAAASVPFGSSCSSQTRTCNDGVMSGSFTATSCKADPPASCSFNGQTVAHGASVTAYSADSVPNGTSCSNIAQTRTCSNGTLSGSFTHPSCTVQGLISTGVTVTVNCSIHAANTQVLKITQANGAVISRTMGAGEGVTVPTYTLKFDSAPTAFQAYSNGALSATNYSNKTEHSLDFGSEDGGDNDYNDLVCSFRW